MTDALSADQQPRTRAGRLLLMAGLTFHSGRRLADYPQMIADIEAEAAEQSVPLDVERLRKAVETAFEEGREWEPVPWRSAENHPVWPFDKFTAIVQREYARLLPSEPSEPAQVQSRSFQRRVAAERGSAQIRQGSEGALIESALWEAGATEWVDSDQVDETNFVGKVPEVAKRIRAALAASQPTAGEEPVRAMYGRLAEAHESESPVPDRRGGVKGDKYPLDKSEPQP